MSKEETMMGSLQQTVVLIEEPVRLKTFVGPWTRKGQQLLLACGKCQKRLRQDGGDDEGLGKLKKALKSAAKERGEKMPLRVITVPCLKVCPKRGVAVCTQAMLGEGRGGIVRTRGDLELLLDSVQEDGLGGSE